MFEYTLLHWSAFFSAAVLLAISPGPDIAYILGSTVRGGTRQGVAAMLGIWAGAFVHVVMAVAGLSAILMTSATAFTVVKWIGAAYLIWIGIQALRSSGGGLVAEDTKRVQGGMHRVFAQGMLICTLNPKVAVFFLAFLPQFVVPGAGPTWAQLLLHGVLVIAVSALIEPPLVMVANRLAKLTKANPAITRWMDRGMGSLLIFLGIRLAVQER